ncbi:hypothetical protein NDU88_001505 [Pleurodeles waltl]|uniref:CCHC-type domain-containing protein n=1 Tax=Pleurodeles waltl TaxID=8319 RepID=A0AAV7U6N4_PLEWA|nr:hypothetical protein NDU88_001505 [Pleurodeles waltl]
MSSPPPFLATPGEPPIPWKQWKKMFSTYLLAIGGDRYSPIRRQAILLHHLGIEGKRIYEDLPEVSLGMGDGQPSNLIEMSLQMLDLQFTPKTNLVLERHKFFSRMQGADEDVASYVATLRGLALSCRFEQLSDCLIKDQIVRCAYSKKIREKLLMKDPSLEEAIQVAKRMEHTAVWLQEMDVSNKEGRQNVINEIKNKGKFIISEEKKRSTRNWEDPNRGKSDAREVKCYRCGAPGHIASSKMCAARNAICRNCGKRGHFAKVCKFKNNGSSDKDHTIQDVQDVCGNLEEIILTVEENSIDLAHDEKAIGELALSESEWDEAKVNDSVMELGAHSSVSCPTEEASSR